MKSSLVPLLLGLCSGLLMLSAVQPEVWDPFLVILGGIPIDTIDLVRPRMQVVAGGLGSIGAVGTLALVVVGVQRSAGLETYMAPLANLALEFGQPVTVDATKGVGFVSRTGGVPLEVRLHPRHGTRLWAVIRPRVAFLVVRRDLDGQLRDAPSWPRVAIADGYVLHTPHGTDRGLGAALSRVLDLAFERATIRSVLHHEGRLIVEADVVRPQDADDLFRACIDVAYGLHKTNNADD